MTEQSTSATPSPSRAARRRRVNWRVVVVQFLLDIVMIALVLGLMPGIRVEFDLSFLNIAGLAVIYGLLNAFIRPALDLLLGTQGNPEDDGPVVSTAAVEGLNSL